MADTSQQLALCGQHRLIVADGGEWARRGAGFIAETLAAAVAARGRASIALGGDVALRPIYHALAGLDLPWTRLDFYFAVESCVPPDHIESSCRLAREALFDVAPVPPENVRRIHAERDDRDVAAAEYGALLPDELDLVLLAMGEDHHVAGLFPGSDWSRATGRKVIVVDAPRPPSFRLTITPDVVVCARQQLIVAAGAGKARQVKQALWGGYNPYLYPAQLARKGTWLLDRAAARELETDDGAYV